MEEMDLGPYRLGVLLGSGGMGRVYRAEVIGTVPGLEPGCSVALKVIHAHLLETPGFFKRFLREADLGRSIEHANVVRTYDCDALLQDGVQQNFLVMEYVEGQTLRDLLGELERVPEELCRHIGREVARGLAAIHEAGIVHRDLKPENVLITPEQVVKIMDLGVARLQDETLRLSQTGAFVGSIEYAAPEQFRSSEGGPDGRADLHALGVVLYELSTGRHPYRDDDASKVLRRILEEEPRKVGEVNPQLSPFFEEVVQTLIAKDREQRFAAASDLDRLLTTGEQSEWWRERAKALRVETKQPLRRIRIPRETALYGRDEDLARLQALYQLAREGEGQVLLIQGEAGIGKTRLVDEFVGRLRQDGEDVNFLFGSYAPGGAATASGAFSEAYREQFGVQGSAPWLEQTPMLVPAFDALLRGEPAPKDVEPLTKDSLGTVFVHATNSLAAERPTIVLIDDLHFAPEDARSLFTSLALSVPGHRVLLVGTLRPGVDEKWLASLTRLDHATQVPLTRLGPKDLVDLLVDSFRSDRLARELAGQIAVKSDGNPFFAFEIVQGLREGQFIAKRPDGTWASTGVIEDIQIPSTVRDLIRARLQDLSEEERELLDVASCCGFEFDPELVARVLGRPAIPALRAFGRIETRHRLVRSAGADLQFDHHQVQESLYEGLLERLRVRYHAAIAQALEAGVGDEPGGSMAVDLCEHFFMGLQGERALRYLDAALGHLEGGYLHDQAIALAKRALTESGLLQGQPRLDLLLHVVPLLDPLGRRVAQKELLDEAQGLAQALEARHAMLLVERYLGAVHWNTGAYAEAGEHFERYLGLAREAGDRKAEADALCQLGNAYYRRDRHEEAIALYEQGLALAEAAGDIAAHSTACTGLGNIHSNLGHVEQARSFYEQGIEDCRKEGARRWEAMATMNLGNLVRQQGDHAEARAHYQRGLEIAREIGDRVGESGLTSGLGNLCWDVGLLAEARSHHERTLRTAREIGDRHGEAVALVNLGPIHLDLGDRRRAREILEAALVLCREIGTRYPEGYALLGLSAVAAEDGEGERALRLAEESLALRREIGHVDGVMLSLLHLAGLCWRGEDVRGAREALTSALLLGGQPSASRAEALALLACLPDGDLAAAEAALPDAGVSWNDSRIRYYLWKATGRHEHLAEAKRRLDHRLEHAPAESRASMLQGLWLNRQITKAWAQHGAGAATEGESD